MEPSIGTETIGGQRLSINLDCPELAKQLKTLLNVDCRILIIVVLRPEWSNDAIFGNGTLDSEL